MPHFAGRFEFLEQRRGAVRAGACELQFDERTVTIVSDGPPLAFDLGDIDRLESGEYEIRLSLYDGHDVVLTRFAKAFQDLDRQLREAYRDRLVQCLLVSDLDEVARFAGWVDLESPDRTCAGPAELRVYESNLAVLPDVAQGFQWRLADIDRVALDEANYAVVVQRGEERLRVGRLAKRTGELADTLRSRMRALGERSARTLHAVFPFLAPAQFSCLADMMREGTSASIARLGGLHPLVERVLLEGVVDTPLAPYVKALAGRSAAPWFAGFKIIRSEAADSAEEINPDVDPASSEDAGDSEAGAGDVAEPAAGKDLSMLEVGEGLEALFWFFFPLSADGGEPTHVAWETTSHGGRATYVFRRDPTRPCDAEIAAINRGLVAVNFRREPIYLDDRTLQTTERYRHYAIAQRKLEDLRRVRQAFVGRAIHTTRAAWAKKLESLTSRK
jgi:hypothetical protein